MKRHIGRRAGLVLAACLIANSAGARKTSIDSLDALARALVAKLPRGAQSVYVALPSWKKGPPKRKEHYYLLKALDDELGQAISAAKPDDKVVTVAGAAGILAKIGFDPLDVYFSLNKPRYAAQAASLIGATVAVTGLLRQKKNAILYSIEATGPRGKKYFGELTASLPISPQFRELLSRPDLPIRNSAGLYLAGVNGVEVPDCVRCPSPLFPWQVTRYSSGQILVGFTIDTNGKVSDVRQLLLIPPTRGIARGVLRAVRYWKFRPVHGPDGKPLPVRMVVVFPFGSYGRVIF